MLQMGVKSSQACLNNNKSISGRRREMGKIIELLNLVLLFLLYLSFIDVHSISFYFILFHINRQKKKSHIMLSDVDDMSLFSNTSAVIAVILKS
jgi:hypothetical protein